MRVGLIRRTQAAVGPAGAVFNIAITIEVYTAVVRKWQMGVAGTERTTYRIDIYQHLMIPLYNWMMQANNQRNSNGTGVQTRSMRNILSDYRCDILFDILSNAGVERSNALKIVKCYWNIFKDIPWNSPSDDQYSNDSYENRNLDAIAQSYWYELIADIEETGEYTYEEATALVDLIIDGFDSRFQNSECEIDEYGSGESSEYSSGGSSEHEAGI